jgi:pimeloyl-ACP methyl ester carboxylesterase
MQNSEVSGSGSSRRGCLFHIRRAIIWTGAGLILLIVLGVGYQAIAAEMDRRQFLPPGQMVEVEGRPMHIYCTGEGQPSVILEAGAFSFSSEWYWVQQQLERTNRICSYDRAGNGWSEVADGSRDGLVLVRELHNLLERAGVQGPYVIVGHSLGGVLAPIYAAQYPDAVAGIVLVDSAVPLTWPDRSGYEAYKSQNESAYLLMKGLTYVGITRVILNNEFGSFGYPAAATAELAALKSTAQAVDTWDAEVRLAQWELGQQLYSIPELGNLPVVVLWASNPDITAPEDRAILAEIWARLPVFSNNHTVRIIDGANHGSIVGDEQYALQVTDAVLDVINAVRTGEPVGN